MQGFNHISALLPELDMTYRVFVEDNSQYMQTGMRKAAGSFPTAEEAIEAARQIVDKYLKSVHRPGMTSPKLFEDFKANGADPFITAEGANKVEFSAWAYAKRRCDELCAPAKTA
jgi:hypothetical protein